MILIIGDSNLRNVVEENQRQIQTALNEEIVFEQAGTNDSIKAILEAQTSTFTKIFIGSILNEIGKLAKVARTRDEVINNITKEQIDIISLQASLKPDVTFVALPPFMRFEPAWITDKLRTITLNLKDHLENANKANMLFSTPVEILESDLNPDKVHLNEEGKSKLLRSLIGPTIRIAKTPTNQAASSWAVTPVTRSRTKRARDNSSDSEDEAPATNKKSKKTDFSAIILAKLDQMNKDLADERARAAERAENLVAKININIATTANNSKKIEEITKNQEIYNNTMSAIQEDLDVIENENMKNIILIRKLKTDKIIPRAKSEINDLLKTLAGNLVTHL